MSTTHTPQSERGSGSGAGSKSTHASDVTCGHCGGAMDPHEAVRGSFCSWDCLYRHRGEGILDQIRSDHTLCSTCYGVVKDIMPVPEDAPECADGYQYPTENTYLGAQGGARYIDHHGNKHLMSYTRWGCQCGNINLKDTHADIQNANLKDVLSNCLQALYYLYEKGAIPFPPSREAYFDALRENWRDAAYAVGRAVYADTPE